MSLTETIQIVADHFYIFLYRDVLFQQTDGVSMGNPLAPTVANFFLAYIESKLFSQTKSFYPSLFLRYVDDVFVSSELAWIGGVFQSS